MLRKIPMIAVAGLAAGLFAGAALAESRGGIPTPGHAKGHTKHQSHGHDRGRGYYREHRKHGYGHRGHERGYERHGYGHHRSRGSVVQYSRKEVHYHGPNCGHSGYSRSSYRSYSPYGHRGYSRSSYRSYSPYGHHGYHRDYGRASIAGRGHSSRFWVEFDY